MAYTSKRGRRPMESASKSAHLHLVNSPAMQDFLERCSLPKRASEISLDKQPISKLIPPPVSPIRHIIAIDGGYTEVPVRVEFPSALVCFFQFGALTFKVQDLEELEDQPFIDPNDMSKLKRIQRHKLILPIRNVALQTEATLTHSIRKAIYDFFRTEIEEGLTTLRWFIFQEYDSGIQQWVLATCPHCDQTRIPLERNRITSDFMFSCNSCQGEIFLTDVFRLHEAIDDDIGASGILGYVTTTVEQLLLVHMIRLILQMKPGLLDEFLFIKDGPLAFFGQTANMHTPMRALVSHLFQHHNLYLAGLEKSGPFVEHADEISPKLQAGQFLILNNEYIYRYILPGQANPARPYGSTTYYGNKLIFKSNDERTFVVTLPTTESMLDPTIGDFPNLHVMLANIEKLRCDMYDDALFPVALVNKLVSLADHPSARILQRFATSAISA